MKRPLSQCLAFASAGFALFFSFVPSQKLHAMGHGVQLGLHNVATQELLRYISVIGTGQRSLVISKSPEVAALDSILAIVPSGMVLAMVESHNNASLHSKMILKNSKIYWNQGLISAVVLNIESALKLQADPFVFIELVDLTEITGAKNRLSLPNGAAKFEPSSQRTLLQSEPFESFQADAESLKKSVSQLSGDAPVSKPGADIAERGSDKGRSAAQSYFITRMQEYGISSQPICYVEGGRNGCNVVGEIAGNKPNSVVIVSGHLDSVSNKGADDDASGIAAMIEMARLYQNKKPESTIRFVAWDQEELGLIGSKAYVKQLKKDNSLSKVTGVFQMDMIGFDSNNDGKIHVMDCGRSDSLPLTRTIKEQLARSGSPLAVVEACTNRSDHASFWNVNTPATIVSENFFGGDENTCYHKKCDTLDIINMAYFTNIVSLVSNSVWAFANK